ncbi:MAG: hypothetical protein QME93_11155 [Bacillota bacterium]|nr:hypothetical protein [Bacillota bacterium]
MSTAITVSETPPRPQLVYFWPPGPSPGSGGPSAWRPSGQDGPCRGRDGRERRLREGIPLEEATVAILRKVARELDLDAPV